MTQALFFLRTSVRHLLRGGQRSLVALLCIAFGVMSLIAMTTLAQSIARTMILNPSEMLGADLSIERAQEDFIRPEQLANLDALRQDGTLAAYSPAALNTSLALRLPGSGQLHFVSTGLGIDPTAYPLAGRLVLGPPASIGLPTLLQSAGDIILTSDLTNEMGLAVGDPVLVSDIDSGVTIEATLRAVAIDTPNHQGSKMYFSYETAARFRDGKPYLNVVMANARQPEAVQAALEGQGWSVFLASTLGRQQESSQDLIDTLLRGAGILGLLVGAIGIANTMQVLLRRRRKEVAVWKTLGYREWHLQALFAAEAAWLGLAGSLLGAGAGVAVSMKLVELFGRTSNLMITWSFSPATVITSMLVGVLTTVIFAMVAIVAVGQVQPLALLRNEALQAGRLPRAKMALLLVLLAVPFTILTSLSMGSLLKGIGVLVFALAGLVVLGGLLGGAAWLVTRLLPFGRLPLMRMAKNSLRRRGLGQVFAMIALFTGVVSLSFGFVITQTARREMQERSLSDHMPYNIALIAPASQQASVRREVQALSLERWAAGYKTAARSIAAQVNGETVAIDPVLTGREDPHDYAVEGAPWGSAPEGVYVYEFSGIPTGAPVTLTLNDGSTHTLEVAGTYSPDFLSSPTRQYGLLVPAELLLRLGPPDTVQFFLRAPAGQVRADADRLGAALPNATVMNLLAYATRYIQTYQNLFVLAVAMAGLALLAGALLIANSVSLAMLDRRYEIGVLKAMGYAPGHILFTLVVEYLLVALIAAAAGLAAVQVFMWIVGLSNPLAASLLTLRPQSAALILLISVGLALVSVLAVAGRATRASPLVVLNDRD